MLVWCGSYVVFVSDFKRHVDESLTLPSSSLPCRSSQIALFANTLLDESVLQPLEDATLQLAGFALRHSRFADGQRLYARIVSSQRLLGG